MNFPWIEVLINAIMWPILNFFHLLSGQILLPNAFAPHFSYNTRPPTLAWSQQFLLHIGGLYQRSAIWHIYSEENLNLASHASILTFFLLYVSLKAVGFIELQG